jgi:hypothetical protein
VAAVSVAAVSVAAVMVAAVSVAAVMVLFLKRMQTAVVEEHLIIPPKAKQQQ